MHSIEIRYETLSMHFRMSTMHFTISSGNILAVQVTSWQLMLSHFYMNTCIAQELLCLEINTLHLAYKLHSTSMLLASYSETEQITLYNYLKTSTC